RAVVDREVLGGEALLRQVGAARAQQQEDRQEGEEPEHELEAVRRSAPRTGSTPPGAWFTGWFASWAAEAEVVDHQGRRVSWQIETTLKRSAQVVNDLGGDGHRECAVLFERQPGELTLAEEGIVQSRVGCADEELHGSGPVRVRRRRLWYHVQQQCSRSSLRQDLEPLA